MGRPREFDEEHALTQALLTFWRQGYTATSLRDLIDATGLGRQSLYNTFGDKRALFRDTLALYRRRIDADLAPLYAPEAELADVRRYIEGALAAQRELGSGACMLVVTAFGPEADDPEIAAAIHGGADAVRRAFEAVATRCGARDPAAEAARLFTVLNGLSALSRTGGTPAQQRAVLDNTFAKDRS